MIGEILVLLTKNSTCNENTGNNKVYADIAVVISSVFSSINVNFAEKRIRLC